jgi:hypothetical protein
MANIIMLILTLAVIGSTTGILFWYFRKLRLIEEELWGSKRKEAHDTAVAAAEAEAETEVDEDTTEH